MKILVPLSSLHCQDGIAVHLATLLPRLRGRGVEITCVTGLIDSPAETGHVLDRIKSACRTFAVDPAVGNTRPRTPGEVLRQAKVLRSWEARCEADVIHLHGRALGPPTLLNGMIGGAPRVFTKHLANAPGRRGGVRAAVRRKAHALWGQRAVAISRAMIDDLRQNEGFPPSRIRYIPHGVDLNHFRPATPDERLGSRRQLGLAPDTFVCLQLARVGPIKRPDTLAVACRALRAAGVNAVALFAGYYEPHDRAWLESVVSDDPQAIRIVGQQDARTALWCSDVTVLCSEREGFPISIVEAMGCGVLPLRTTVQGATDQIRHGENGYLFDVGDVDALVGHLSRLHADRALRDRMGEATLRAAKTQFAADVMADRTIKVYEEVVGGGVPRTAAVDAGTSAG